MNNHHFVGTIPELLQNKGRKRCTVGGKDIFVVLNNGQPYAFDSFCYHAGGPLYQGDIEDVSGKWCIVCPWHKYKIHIDSGEGLYHSVDPHDLKKPPKLCSKGRKQRTHSVIVKGEQLFVVLSDPQNPAESDQYNKQV
ncbi:Rieske domain-containing protein-like [Physella acuta]|uniref:Rieske domain-containing protein-like n=1 Tax=Physella acuta TaxID=109671 RepID=UPI0027DD9542|nr:Rieske domain-containing protein-like [Physella acuta]XP_059173560.1 Rieske domain-containing protein-like [Physella acuta]XP_059173561.1 Rieske domain-containing protein-like [Physella acuta]